MEWRELSLALRRHLIGPLVVRRGLPKITPSPALAREAALYQAFCALGLPADTRAGVTQVIDVGCRNWSYAAALSAAFPKAQLVGVEVDGNRRFTDLFRRIDHARAFAAQLSPPATVVHGDFRKVALPPGHAHDSLAFTCFFPFVSPDPARAWGLPASFNDFSGVFSRTRAHADGRQAVWLSVHQGEWEAAPAARTYRALGFSAVVRRLSASLCPEVDDSPYEPFVIAATVTTAGSACL